MEKFEDWEIELREHMDKQGIEPGPEQTQAMENLLNKEMPVRKKIRPVWFIVMFILAGATYWWLVFDSTGPSNSQNNISLLSESDSIYGDEGSPRELADEKKDDGAIYPGQNRTRAEHLSAHSDHNSNHNMGVRPGSSFEYEPEDSPLSSANNKRAFIENESIKNGSTNITQTNRKGHELSARRQQDMDGAAIGVSTDIDSETAIETANKGTENTGIQAMRSELNTGMFMSAKGKDDQLVADKKPDEKVKVDATMQSTVVLLSDSVHTTENDTIAEQNDSAQLAILDSMPHLTNSIPGKKDRSGNFETPQKTSFDFELNISGSLFKSSRKLIYSRPSDFSTFRNEGEQALLATDVGLGVNLVMKNHYLVSSGLNRLSLTDQTNYTDIRVPRYQSKKEKVLEHIKEIESIDSFFVQLDNERVLVIDTQFINRVETTYVTTIDTQFVDYQYEKRRVRLNYFQIPLELGYRFYARSTTFDFSGGLGLNFLQGMQGNYHTLTPDTLMLLNDKSLRKFSLSASLGITASYHLGKGYHLTLGARASYYPNMMLGDFDPIQRYRLAGLRLGMSYRF